MKKPYMFLYPTGARGDFLISILIGDVLEASYTDPWIVYHMASERYIKTHDAKRWFPVTEEFTNFADYSIVRIKVENKKDARNIVNLANYKMPHSGKLDKKFTLEWEKTFSLIDHQVDYIVPFSGMFDINYLEDLFFKFRSRVFSKDERQRILHNIELNKNILKGKTT